MKTQSTIKRVLAGLFGALMFGILVPLLYVLIASLPDSLSGFVWLVLIGVATGATLGALFPRVFGFVFEAFLTEV